jgi:hypothetical protein
VLQIGSSEEAFLVGHAIDAGLNLGDAHSSSLNGASGLASQLLALGLIPAQRLNDFVKSSPTTSTTFFWVLDSAIN